MDNSPEDNYLSISIADPTSDQSLQSSQDAHGRSPVRHYPAYHPRSKRVPARRPENRSICDLREDAPEQPTPFGLRYQLRRRLRPFKLQQIQKLEPKPHRRLRLLVTSRVRRRRKQVHLRRHVARLPPDTTTATPAQRNQPHPPPRANPLTQPHPILIRLHPRPSRDARPRDDSHPRLAAREQSAEAGLRASAAEQK